MEMMRKIGTLLIDPLERQIRYIAHYKKNVENLEKKLEELVTMRNEVKALVDAAIRRGDEIKESVTRWLEKGERIIDDSIRLIDEAQAIINSSLFKCFARYRLGKEAENLICILENLLNEGEIFRDHSSTVSFPVLPSTSQSIPSTRDFLELESREPVRKRIIEALKDVNIKVIGVYGMGGVGKTALMKQIAKQVKTDGLFDKVLIVTVSQNEDLRRIRAEIAVQLGMEFEEADELKRVRQLSVRLDHEKRVLLIFDDLWKKLDLVDVGIPYEYCQYPEGCKVMLTSRSRDVCYGMNAQPAIEVNVLWEQDSWNLFRQVTGTIVEAPDIRDLAIEVVNECKGLPLAIVTIGTAMRNRSEKALWVDTARKLKMPIFDGMRSIFSSIKFSYDNLRSREIKRCFLLCCFFPEGYKFTTNELLPYVIGDVMLQSAYNLENVRAQLQIWLDQLEASGLLMKENEDGLVMMHDVVRDAAISIASEGSAEFNIKAGLGLRRWPDDESLQRCLQMSLMRNEISEFPDQPECPQLLSLSWSRNYSFERLPDSFFESMTSLVTLDLRRTAISSLPLSLLCLENLRILLLDHTSLSDVSLVGKLKKLEMLSLSDNKIERLPEEIGGLSNLKLLDLSKNYLLETIPSNVFSSLSCLEELYMMGSFDGWETRDGNKARLTELVSLERLTILELNVSNAKWLSEQIFLHPENLTKFCIDGGGMGRKPKFSRAMSLKYTPNPLKNWVEVLLKRTEELHLYDCKGLTNIVQLNAEGFNNLKFLHIDGCLEMEYLMSVAKKHREAAFSALEVLDICNMNSLEAIYDGPLPNGFLKKLKFLSLYECHKIINALHCDLLARVENLEKLSVSKCEELKEVFHSERLEEGHVVIPRLKEISLLDLPKVTTIWKGIIPVMSFQRLELMKVVICDGLRYLFSRTMVQRLGRLEHLTIAWCEQMMEIIQLEEEEEDETVSEDVLEISATSTNGSRQSKTCTTVSILFQSHPVFPNLKVLEISGCHALNHLFPIEVVRSLSLLQVLQVDCCNGMEKIIVGEEGEEGGEEDKMVLPQLRTLKLTELPNLMSFYQWGLLFDCPSLEDLTVKECPNLNRLPLDPQSVAKLRVIEVDSVEWFDWEHQSVRARLERFLQQD